MVLSKRSPAKSAIRLNRPLLPPLKEFSARLDEVWSDAWLTNFGKQSVLLEKRLSGLLGCENLSLFCNGTMALLLGLKALELHGEVVTTPFTFPATIHALNWVGLTPVFADIDPGSLAIDPKCVEEAITERTSAILAVHVFGIPCAVHALADIARRHKLKLIYDSAHAFGTEIDGTPIGQFGDMSMFSFHATKLFHTAEGGALACRDPAIRTQLQLLQNFGIQDEDTVVLSGLNGKMNEIQAALGLCILDHMEAERRIRTGIEQLYSECLADVDGISILKPPANVTSSCQYLPILVDERARHDRDEIYSRLKFAEITSRRYFQPLCSDYPCYRDLPSAAPGNLPVAQARARQILCLPLHGDLSDDDIHRICDLVKGKKSLKLHRPAPC